LIPSGVGGRPPTQQSVPFEGTETRAEITGALVRSLDIDELKRFRSDHRSALAEIERFDAGLAKRLAGPLRELAR
jgi:hypothetical protein